MTMTGNAGNAYYKRYDTSVILDLGLDGFVVFNFRRVDDDRIK